jgi:outer membrane protein TolC
MKKITIILASLIAFSGLADAQKTLTFNEAVQRALMNNYSIQIRKADVLVSDNLLDNKLGQSGALPSLNANAGYQYQNNDIELEFAGGLPPQNQEGAFTENINAGVQLDWTVFDGFAMFVQMDRLELLSEMSQIQLQLEIENTIRSIAQAYYNGVIARNSIELLQNSIQRSRQNLERLETQQEYGQASTSDILRAEVNINTDSSAVLQNTLAYTNTLYQLNNLMGAMQEIDYDISSDVELGDLPDLREVRKTALNQNTAILLAVKDRELTQSEYDLIISQYYPRLTLTGGYSITQQESNGGFLLFNEAIGYNVGANLQWNLFDGFRTATAAENNQIAEEQKEIAIKRIRNTVDMNVMIAYDNYAQRLTLYELERNSLAAAKSSFERASELYKTGRINSLELRDAQLQLLNTQTRISSALYQAKLAETELEILMGRSAEAIE